jgi:transposase-like protein
MTKREVKSGTIDVKALLAGDEEFLRALVRMALQEVLEAEMTEALEPQQMRRSAYHRGCVETQSSAATFDLIAHRSGNDDSRGGSLRF